MSEIIRNFVADIIAGGVCTLDASRPAPPVSEPLTGLPGPGSRHESMSRFITRLRLILCLTALFGFSVIADARNIVVIDFSAGTGVSAADAEGLSSIFTTYFTPKNASVLAPDEVRAKIQARGYSADNMSEAQMYEMGKALGADVVVFGKITLVLGEYNVDIKAVSLTNNSVLAGEGRSFTASSYRESMKAVAETLAAALAGAPAAGGSTSSGAEEKVFSVVEEPPTFPGGDAAMYQFLAQNITYPAAAMNAGVQGRVVLQFVVEKDGSIGEVKVVRSVDEQLDKEAVRIVRRMPRFIPGKMNGQAVRVWFTLPVNFRLQGAK